MNRIVEYSSFQSNNRRVSVRVFIHLNRNNNKCRQRQRHHEMRSIIAYETITRLSFPRPRQKESTRRECNEGKKTLMSDQGSATKKMKMVLTTLTRSRMEVLIENKNRQANRANRSMGNIRQKKCRN